MERAKRVGRERKEGGKRNKRGWEEKQARVGRERTEDGKRSGGGDSQEKEGKTCTR